MKAVVQIDCRKFESLEKNLLLESKNGLGKIFLQIIQTSLDKQHVTSCMIQNIVGERPNEKALHHVESPTANNDNIDCDLRTISTNLPILSQNGDGKEKRK
jgi:hypothetical protein